MFKKKIKIDEKPKAPDKQTQLGPKPDDVTCTDELITFEVILRDSLPSIRVQAHGHNFGIDEAYVEGGCRGTRSAKFTRFWVNEYTTWAEHGDWVKVDFYGYYRWQWRKREVTRDVLSVRTDNVFMVVAVDNASASTEETLALSHREPAPTPRNDYYDGGQISVTYDSY